MKKVLVLNIRSNLTFFHLTKYSLSIYYILGPALASRFTAMIQGSGENKVGKEVCKCQPTGVVLQFYIWESERTSQKRRQLNTVVEDM